MLASLFSGIYRTLFAVILLLGFLGWSRLFAEVGGLTVSTSGGNTLWSGQLLAPATADFTCYLTTGNFARIWFDGRLVASKTQVSTARELRFGVPMSQGGRYNFRVEFLSKTPTAILEWSTSTRGREEIPLANRFPEEDVFDRGGLLLEQWLGLTLPAGASSLPVSALTSLPAYQAGRPTARQMVSSSESPQHDWADGYGERFSGFLVPMVSGTYQFAVAGDAAVELWLGTGPAPDSLVRISQLTTATAPRNWTSPSPGIVLQAGERYALRLLHVAGSGSDHVAAAWRVPGSQEWRVIPGECLVPGGIGRAQPAEADLLHAVSSGHPRVFAGPGRFALIRQRYQEALTDPEPTDLGNGLKSLVNKARGYVSNGYQNGGPPVLVGHPRGVLYAARDSIEWINTLAMAWQLTGDAQFVDKTWVQIDALAALPDWDSPGFNLGGNDLAWSELTRAVAVGYDLLHDALTPAQRTVCRDLIVKRSLAHFLDCYTTGRSWAGPGSNNWGAVCHGGVLMGALAVADDDPALAGQVRRCLKFAIDGMRGWTNRPLIDNGGSYEGSYWFYQTPYFTLGMGALEHALGSDFGISGGRGLREMGTFPIQSVGPSGTMFPIGDDNAGGPNPGGIGTSQDMFWLARRYHVPAYAYFKRLNKGSYYTEAPMTLLWWDESGTASDLAAVPLDNQFRGSTPYNPAGLECAELVVMRQSWDDRATFAGLKGNTFSAGHNIWDAGSFLIDALGKRWIHKIGGDRIVYSSPINKALLYLDRAEGANTLVFNPSRTAKNTIPGQANANSQVIFWESRPDGDRSTGVVNLQPAYAEGGKVVSLLRGMRLINGKRDVVVQDEILRTDAADTWWGMHVRATQTFFKAPTITTAPAPNLPDQILPFVRSGDGRPADGITVYTKTQDVIDHGVRTTTSTPYTWQVHTAIAIAPDGKSVTLTNGPDRMWIRILGTNDLTFLLQDAKPLAPGPGENFDATDFKKLVIRTTTKANVKTTISVYFRPLEAGEAIPQAVPAIEPLSAWMSTVNEPPVATGGRAFGPSGGPVDIDLRSLVQDQDSTPSDWTFSVSGAIQGSVSILGDGHTARFLPADPLVPAPSFSYTVTDARSQEARSGTVAVSVTPLVSTWRGTGAWSLAANWSGAGTPATARSGQVDLFPGAALPAGTTRMEQDIPGLQLNRLTLGGHGPSTGPATVLLTGQALGFLANNGLRPSLALIADGPDVAYDLGTPFSLTAGLDIVGDGTAGFRQGGGISGSGDLIKTGTSRLVLAAGSTYTGKTVISGGALVAVRSGALGTADQPTLVEAGGTLGLAEAVAYGEPEPVTLVGAGAKSCPGALAVVDDTAVSFAGPVTLAGPATIGADRGTLTVTKDITTDGYGLTLHGSGDIRLEGTVLGAGGLAKTGPGSATLTRLLANSGGVRVEGGALITRAAYLASVPVVGADGTLVLDEATDGTLAWNVSGSGTLEKRGPGTLTLGAALQHLGPTRIAAGALRMAGKPLSDKSELTIATSGTLRIPQDSSYIHARMVLDGGTIMLDAGVAPGYFKALGFDLHAGVVARNVLLQSSVSGQGGAVKTGPGTVLVSGGIGVFTTIEEGAVQVTGSLSTTVVHAGGALLNTGTVNGSVTLDSGALYSTGAAPSLGKISGNFSVRAGSTVRLRIDGPVAGSQYDQVQMTGSASVTTLAGSLELVTKTILPVGGSYQILNHTQAGGVINGAFAGMPEGARFFMAEQGWHITYQGGSGHAIVLTRVDLPPSYPLVVTGGSGDGAYAPGSVVPVVADAPASGQVFSGWTVTPDSVVLGSRTGATTTLTMPAGAVTLVATYAPVKPGIPVITSELAGTATVGTWFSYAIRAVPVPVSFQASGLPDGLACQPGTGTISGTPVRAGTYPVTISAVNGSGVGSAVLTLSIVAPPPTQVSGGGEGTGGEGRDSGGGGGCGVGSGLGAMLGTWLGILALSARRRSR